MVRIGVRQLRGHFLIDSLFARRVRAWTADAVADVSGVLRGSPVEPWLSERARGGWGAVQLTISFYEGVRLSVNVVWDDLGNSFLDFQMNVAAELSR